MRKMAFDSRGEEMKKDNSKKNHSWKHVGGPMLIGRSDKRYEEYREIQKETGVSPDETWNLDETIAMFVLPRLKMFRNDTIGYPCELKSIEEWHGILDRMIDSFGLMCEQKTSYEEDEQSRIEEGLDLFRKWFHALWW